VARFAVEQGLDHRKLYKMENEAVIAYVTQIKGVGRWTVEMLLMIALEPLPHIRMYVSLAL
jgi:DNA-3-methyladenine glycosylase II